MAVMAVPVDMAFIVDSEKIKEFKKITAPTEIIKNIVEQATKFEKQCEK